MRKKKERQTLLELMILGYGIKTSSPFTGSECMKLLGLLSGSVYPTLRRLTEQGYLTQIREQGDASVLGRPLYMRYEVTPKAHDPVMLRGGIELAEWAMKFNIIT